MLTSQRSYSDGGDEESFTLLWLFMSALLYTCTPAAKFKGTRLKLEERRKTCWSDQQNEPVKTLNRVSMGDYVFKSKHIIFPDSSSHERPTPLSGVRQARHMTSLSISTSPSAKRHTVCVPLKSKQKLLSGLHIPPEICQRFDGINSNQSCLLHHALS